MRDRLQKRTITQIIERHILDYQHETAISWAAFVSSVRKNYEAMCPEHNRFIEFSNVYDASSKMTRDAEKFRRWLETDIKARFPMEIMEATIMAFPPDRRFRLQTELAARQDMLAVPMPGGAGSDDGISLGRIAKESGEAMIAISELFEDGVIDHQDRKKAPEAIRQIEEAIAVLASMKVIIEKKALSGNAGDAKLKIAKG